MSMFNVKGKLVRVYRQERTDRESGEVSAETRAQLMGDVPTRDGKDSRLDLVDVRIPADLVQQMRGMEGKEVSVPIGFFAAAKGHAVVFIPRGSKATAAA